jgi:LysR family nitrogen assimilation transcriptional regulator
MDFKQLQIFAMVCQTGSLCKASDRLRISQPALTRHIKLLEQEIGHALFVRTGRGMQLTEAGSDLHARASGLVAQLENAVAEVRTSSSRPSGKVVLGIIPSISYLLAAHIVVRVAHEFPDIRLRIVEGFGGNLIDWLHRGEVDAIIIYGPGADLHLRVREMVYEEIFLIAPASAKFPAAELPFSHLADMQLVLPSRPHGLRSLIESAAEKAGVALQVKYEIDSFYALKSLVTAEVGSTLLPFSAFGQDRASSSLQAIKLVKPNVMRQVVLALPSDRIDTRATAAVVALIEDDVRRMVERGEWNAIASTARR